MTTETTKPSAKSRRSFWQRFWYNSEGQLVVWQRPNLLLITWALATITSRVLPAGTAQHAIGWIGRLALLGWALAELGRGDSYWRRLLGLTVIVFMIVGLWK